MDMKSKGIAWVGNIYHKLEAMCEEVDSFMSQDKIRYEKKQVQARRDTAVQKLCTGFMQDLVLSSDSSVEQAVSDSLPTKLEVIVPRGEYSNPEPLLDGSPHINHEEACDKLIQKSIPISIEVTINNHPENAGVNYENVADPVIDTADYSVVQPFESTLPVVLNNVVEEGMISPSCDISTDVTGEVFSSKSYETIFLVEFSGDGNKEHGKPLCEASLPQPEIGICVSAMTPMRRSSHFDWQEASKSSITAEQSTETIDEFEDVKLDDDCSDTDIVKNEIVYIYRQARKKRSYKKKLQDALTSKLRPTKKPDYEQIAIWYAEAETRRRAGESSSASTVLHSKGRLTHDSCISDWELL
ncbi:hypothetical protein CKAN_01538800 [Cinnamomum micranthum f. kanehirae]|uniref:Uncharacterized protein n=1 Tax=Cinnamomum micranthum f. kanehirae TaxID=337451 RepID=A0A3S3NTY6_9MAGN|nr:hypothetical protein CKAN_01538800 [Cinnamomum micranthum f. kanehirae]